MTSGPDPVAVTSQDARVEFDAKDTPEMTVNKVNDALTLIRDDIQRLAGSMSTSIEVILSSGNFRLAMTATGIADFWAISNTATTGSTGAAYHVLTLKLNGTTPLTLTYDTRRVEIPAYLGGAYIGQIPVSYGDIATVALAVTGAPAPTLTTDNFCLLCKLRES